MNVAETGRLSGRPEYLNWYIEKDYVRLQDERIIYLDPVTGQDLSLKTLPECIKEDRICGPGFENLKRRSDEGGVLNFEFNLHDKQDSEILLSEAGGILLGSEMVGVECNGGKSMGIPLNRSDITWDDMPYEGLGAYIKDIQDFVGVEKTVPCDIDYPLDDDDKLRHRLAQLLVRARTTVDQKISQGREADITRDEWGSYHLGWSAYHYIRGYGMVGTLGYMASLFELQADDEITLVVGCGHSTAIPEKMDRYGIRYNAHIIQKPTGGLQGEVRDKGMLGLLKLADLDAIAELEFSSRH